MPGRSGAETPRHAPVTARASTSADGALAPAGDQCQRLRGRGPRRSAVCRSRADRARRRQRQPPLVRADELRAGRCRSAGAAERLCRPREPVAGLALDRPLSWASSTSRPTASPTAAASSRRCRDRRTRCGWRRRAPTSSTSAASRRRPGSDAVDLDEECRRVLPVIAGAGQAQPRPPLDRYAQGGGDAARGAWRARTSSTTCRRWPRSQGDGDRRRHRPAGGPDARAGRSAHHAGRAPPTPTWCSTSTTGSRRAWRPASGPASRARG